MMNRFSFVLLGLTVAACSSSSTSSTSGGTTAPDGGAADGAVTDAPPGGTQCTSARQQLLLPIEKVSIGQVSVLSDAGGKKTIYVDAAAGGLNNAAKSPRVYIDLGAGTRVAVTDTSATQSKDWDLALKRSVIFTNGGDTGLGDGGAAAIAKPFAGVTAADVRGATVNKESLFDADCNAKLDPTGAPATTFSDWYDYDQATNIPTPKPGVTYAVRGGTGKLYKVGIKAYDALPDGGSRNNMSTGFYLLEVTEVTAQ